MTVRFDINQYWTFKLEGHHIDGVAQVVDFTDPSDLSKTWSLYGAKATFSF